MNYEYPLEETWTKEDMVNVIHFFTCIEKAYETSIDRDELLNAYRIFKQIVPAKGEEKSYFASFEKQSGYSSYHAVKLAKNTKAGKITLRS